MNTKDIIKENIRRQGFSLKDVADKMGVSVSALSQVVAGNPTLTKLQEIADIIGMPVAALLDEDYNSKELTCPHCGKPIRVSIR